MTQTVRDVADYLLVFCQENGDYLTNLKLQKLLYYIQAWHLALKDRPLFDGPFEAWVHGPVNVETYRRFKECGWQPILDRPEVVPELDIETKQHIADVMDVFSSYSAYDLERMTHQEDPWINARKGLSEDAPSNNIISEDEMKHFYRNLSEKNDQNKGK